MIAKAISKKLLREFKEEQKMGRKILFILAMIVSIIAMAFCCYLFYYDGAILALVVAGLIFVFMSFVAYKADENERHEWCDKDFIKKHRVR